jgi:hypothetical protein
MRWTDIVESQAQADYDTWLANYQPEAPPKHTQEYQGQNAFIERMRKNPRFMARLVAATKKLRNDFAAASKLEDNSPRVHNAALNILGNFPSSDASVEPIVDRIGNPDWDECDANPAEAVKFALAILDDAVENPVDWDCIAGMAMRYVMGRSKVLDIG